MAFLLFERVKVGSRNILRPTGETFSLAGYNLIYKAWQQLGSPVDDGWHASADSLIQLHTGDAHNYATRRLVIDFDPKATWRIGLIELLDVYAFTWGDGKGGPSWTPMMLRFRDLHYDEYDRPITLDQKANILADLDEPATDRADFVEFLYLNGPKLGLNWGKNGMTNAVLVQGAARDYFRRFF